MIAIDRSEKNNTQEKSSHVFEKHSQNFKICLVCHKRQSPLNQSQVKILVIGGEKRRKSFKPITMMSNVK